jgi:hypothetical protein
MPTNFFCLVLRQGLLCSLGWRRNCYAVQAELKLVILLLLPLEGGDYRHVLLCPFVCIIYLTIPI